MTARPQGHRAAPDEPARDPAAQLVLLGLMGAGKSTVGQVLAAALGRPLLDNDTELERREGLPAAEVEALRGRDELHRLEAEVLRACLAAPEPSVVTSSAWAPLGLSPEELDGHEVVWLDIDPAISARRVIGTDHRPLGEDRTVTSVTATLARQRAERGAVFARLADLVVDVGTRPAAELADEVLRWHRGAAHGGRRSGARQRG